MLEMGGIESRFEAYVETLMGAVGHADRGVPLRAYCRGLLLPGDRKSVEPMAAQVAPRRVSAMHQAMHHFVAKAPWSDEAVLGVVRRWTLPALEKAGPILAWIVDDTGFPKKGKHSVGVARQYCGQLGKQDNCQVAVTLSVANEGGSLPIGFGLYLPKEWAEDGARRAAAGVPEAVMFQTKPQIALSQIGDASAQGVPAGVVLGDVAYGNDSGFRDGVSALGLAYAVGIQSTVTVWAPGTAPLPAKPWSGRGRPPTRLRRDGGVHPVSVEALALSLPRAAFRTVTWRVGAAGKLRSRFAVLRVHPAHRDEGRSAPRPQEWLLIEWPKGEAKPTKYFFSTLPADTALKQLVALAKLRWRIERDYEELKQELGLGHYEGRSWRGFHHHATLCIAAYGFLVSERSPIPPSGAPWRPKTPGLPKGWRPRGAPDPARAAQPDFDRHFAPPPERRPRNRAAQMPVLPANQQHQPCINSTPFMTQ
jgi:SRSO17 transposase